MALAIAFLLPEAHALGLGEARARSQLGQPLSVGVPLLLREGETFDPTCLRVVSPRDDEGLPTVRDARLGIETRSGVTYAVITQSRNNNEPVIKLALELGCADRLRREYTLLFDPADDTAREQRPAAVATESPLESVELAERERVAATAPPPPVVIPSAADRRPTRAQLDDAPPRLAARPSAAASRAARPLSAPSRRSNATTDRSDSLRLSGAQGISSEASRVVLATPRLRISNELGAPSSSSGERTDSAANPLQKELFEARRRRLQSAALDEDLNNSLEVDWVVSQKRLAELQARLNVAQSNLQAKEEHSARGTNESSKASEVLSATKPSRDIDPSVPAVRVPETNVPPSSPVSPSTLASRLYAWLWVPLLLGMAGALSLWLWRSNRRAAANSQENESPRVPYDFMEHTQPPRGVGSALPSPLPDDPDLASVSSGRNVAGFTESSEFQRVMSGDEGRGPNTRLPLTTIKGPSPQGSELSSDFFHPKEHLDSMGVHEISAVTEEASVYIELGRLPEAIAILQDHITLERAYERATPAPWLMLLDLFYKTGKQADYEALRVDFAKAFNGEIPKWDEYALTGSLKSLEQHEHIVDRIMHYWGTPKCRVYIETLLYDNRGGSRVGFSLAAYRELVLLMSIHDLAFGLTASGAKGLRSGASDEPKAPEKDDHSTIAWNPDVTEGNTLSPEMPRTIRRIQKHPRH